MATPFEPWFALINDVMIGTKRIRLLDWDDLNVHAPLRGQNRAVPGVAGRRNKRKWDDELPATLIAQLHTGYDDDGAVVPDPPSIRRSLVDLDALLGVGLVQVPFELTDEAGDVWTTEVAQCGGVVDAVTKAPGIANFGIALILPPTLELVEGS